MAEEHDDSWPDYVDQSSSEDQDYSSCRIKWLLCPYKGKEGTTQQEQRGYVTSLIIGCHPGGVINLYIVLYIFIHLLVDIHDLYWHAPVLKGE